MITNTTKIYFSGFILFILVIFQYVLFKKYFVHEILGFYAPNADQSVYLFCTYDLYEKIMSEGIRSAFMKMITGFSTGMLFPINALICFLIFEPGRFCALLPNFIYFILLQFTVFLTIKSITGKYGLSIIGTGLILSLSIPFQIGGITDFRMDFIAFCLYGIVACLVLKSKVFLEIKWSILVSFVASLMILMRQITAVYFFGIVFFLMINFTLTYPQNKKRLFHLIFSTLIICALIFSFIFINRTQLYNYYIVGHLTGSEKLYRGIPGATTFSNLMYYPSMVLDMHLGKLGKIIFGSLISIYTIIYLTSKHKANFNFNWKQEVIFLFLAIVIPIIVLTLDPAKSGVVCGIVVIPILLLTIGFCFFVEIKINSNFYSIILNSQILAFIVVFVGLLNQWDFYYKNQSNKTRLNNLFNVSKMFLDISNYSIAKNWKEVVMSVDQVNDKLAYTHLSILYYEKYHKTLKSNTTLLGGTIFSVTEKEAMENLKKSNVVILTLSKYPDNIVFPFNQSLSKINPVLIKYADKHFKRLGDYQFFDEQYRVYVT